MKRALRSLADRVGRFHHFLFKGLESRDMFFIDRVRLSKKEIQYKSVKGISGAFVST
jgi:hypothetical protein